MMAVQRIFSLIGTCNRILQTQNQYMDSTVTPTFFCELETSGRINMKGLTKVRKRTAKSRNRINIVFEFRRLLECEAFER